MAHVLSSFSSPFPLKANLDPLLLQTRNLSLHSAFSVQHHRSGSTFQEYQTRCEISRWAAELARQEVLEDPQSPIILDDEDLPGTLSPTLSICFPSEPMTSPHGRRTLEDAEADRDAHEVTRGVSPNKHFASVRLAEPAKKRFALEDSSDEEDEVATACPETAYAAKRRYGNACSLGQPVMPTSMTLTKSLESLFFSFPSQSDPSSEDDGSNREADDESDLDRDGEAKFLAQPSFALASAATAPSLSSSPGRLSFSAAAGSFLSLPSLLADKVRHRHHQCTKPASQRFSLSDGEYSEVSDAESAASSVRSWAYTLSEYEFQQDDSDRYRKGEC